MEVDRIRKQYKVMTIEKLVLKILEYVYISNLSTMQNMTVPNVSKQRENSNNICYCILKTRDDL